jgi:PTH1 family peptidyl-tRNA hydrolase
MKLIVGLGNPGEKYENNRHNVGFMFCDYLAKEIVWNKSKKGQLLYAWTLVNDKKIELIKPITFMNKSGEAVRYAVKKHQLQSDDLVVVHDDLDIPLGDFKIQKGVGPKLHNGIASIESHLKIKDFLRVRIGVDARGTRKIDGETYVLSDFTKSEGALLESLFPKIANRLNDLV